MIKNMTDEAYMALAIAEASECLKDGIFPVGSIVVIDDEVVGVGRKTSEGHAGHGEIVALRSAAQNRIFSSSDELVVYTTVEPCLMCFGTILHTPVKRIVYALEDPWAGATHIKAPILPLRYQSINPEIKSGVLRDDSISLVREYALAVENPFWGNKNNPLIGLIGL